MPEASRSAPPPRIVDKLVRSVRLSQYNVLLSIPESARSFQRIIEIPVTRFPFFIIEDRDFEYGGLAFVAERLKKLSRVEVMTMSFERLRLRQGFGLRFRARTTWVNSSTGSYRLLTKAA
jgi:hypothetical protein